MKTRILQISAIALLLLIAVLLFNTFNFKSKQVKVAPIPSKEIGDETIQRLSDVVKMPTVSYETHIDTAAFEDFKNYLPQTFPLIDSLLEKELIGGYSLVYKWQGTNPELQPVLLMAHYDVVPVEEDRLNKWNCVPYNGEIIDGYVCGRGTLDDKHNVMGILEAINLHLQEGFQPSRTHYLCFGHDEEVGGLNGAKMVAEAFKKRGIEFVYALDEGGPVYDDVLPGLQFPAALVGIAEKGYMTVELKVELEEGGHSSIPPKENAIGLLSKALHELETHPFPTKLGETTAAMFDYLGPELPFAPRIVFANRWLFNSLLVGQLEKKTTTNTFVRTTMVPTIIHAGIKENVVPSSAAAKVNVRINPGETIETVLAYFKKVINDERVTVASTTSGFLTNPAKPSSTTSFGYKTLEKTIQQIFPNALVSPYLNVPVTDSRHFAELAEDTYRFSAVKMTPHSIKGIHGFNERISIENYKRLIRFYHQLIVNGMNDEN
ncbi:MAG: M20/M25/M40 family metallo-hydrolase [Chitinophagales bacterium]